MKLLKGNNMELLKTLEDNSVDSCVTDSPYGLKFMGKKWDYEVPSKEFWEEIYRVLKPGGHVLSFGGTRTYHRMVVNMEDAGFEIRDCISWLYGSGFPKSLNIGKQVDKIQGNEREVVGERELQGTAIHDGNHRREGMDTIDITKGTSPQEGWGTGLKPAQELICMARKPISEKTITLNILKWGTGGINVDGCRIETQDNLGGGAYTCKNNMGTANYALKDGRKTLPKNNLGDFKQPEGRFPANIILDEEAAKALDNQSGMSRSGIKGIRKSDGFNENSYGIGIGVKKGEENGEYGDKGGASRFFFKASYNFLEQNEYKMKNECLNNYKLAQYVEQSGLNISQITELIAQTNVEERLKNKLVLLVRSALNLSEKCVMYIVANIVAIATENMASPLTQDFIQELENYILIQNLAHIVEIQDNIDTTPTTQSLMKLFGSVLPVIEKNIKQDTLVKEEQKSEQNKSTYRFVYQAKVSKAERNMGLDGFEEKKAYELNNRKEGSSGMERRPGEGGNNPYLSISSNRKNTHPTVKPINLLTYLIRLVTPKGGIVLDPYMGSGSTGIATLLEGFDFIGMELDEDYFKIASQRISKWEEYKKILK